MSRSNTTSPHLTGPQAESLACKYLQNQGLLLVEKNYRARRGEIDLIMQHNDCLVFIEVRFRHSQAFGGAGGSITAAKLQKIQLAALAYMQNKRSGTAEPMRIDAVTIAPDATRGNQFDIQWIKNISQ